ncbi:MAG: DNA oxidative demethylase AlkB [Burkholderiales bacterium]|nr:DNA oxidative demethylase AlkB [Burkholderiales bacterium]
MTADLFAEDPGAARQPLGRHACLLRGFALGAVDELLTALATVQQASPLRHMVTPGGFTMSVATTNCGPLGWISDRRGYRYTAIDPAHGRAWPAMPESFMTLAREAAAAAGFDGFEPDACLINQYVPGARLSLHQDRDEADFGAPIVSVSLGMSATFQFGGLARTDPVTKVSLHHGDAVVWGGEDRLRFHGVMPLRGAPHPHPQLADRRINLTFRKAG